MIALTRLNGQAMMVNADLIETLEATPDTVVTLVSGNKLIVRDSMETIAERIIAFKRKIYGPPDALPSGERGSAAGEPADGFKEPQA